MMKKFVLVLMAFFMLCVSGPSFAESGSAIIRGTEKGSKRAGWAWFQDTEQGLRVVARVKNLTPGKHGFHIHNFGFCGEKGLNAGDHFNPDGAPHGFLLKNGHGGAHAGDLGNIEVGPDGAGKLDIVIHGLTLAGGKYSVGGRSLVVHEKEDNFGQPAGNAGARIGCGTIFLVSEADLKAKKL
jgi:Cu-Zn family superoxide dismutase